MCLQRVVLGSTAPRGPQGIPISTCVACLHLGYEVMRSNIAWSAGWIERQHTAPPLPFVSGYMECQMVGTPRGVNALLTTTVALFVMSPVVFWVAAAGLWKQHAARWCGRNLRLSAGTTCLMLVVPLKAVWLVEHQLLLCYSASMRQAYSGTSHLHCLPCCTCSPRVPVLCRL